MRASIACAIGVSWLLAAPVAAVDAASTKASEQGHSRRRSCRGVHVPAGANLQVAINHARKGAKLCLGRGTYFTRSGVTLRSKQKLVGVTRSRTVIKSSGASVIDARNTTGVKIKRLSVTGAKGGRRCAPGCGRGISPGRKTKIVRVRVHHNQVLGIGGSRGGLVIKKSEVDHNGHPDLYGCCTGAIKTGTAYTIKDTFVHDNVGVGIWCDVGCKGGKWRVLNNVSVRNTLGGIRYETAGAQGSALIRGNAVRRNNRLGSGGHGGIEINSSRNAVVEKNRVRRNTGPGIIIGGNRRPGLGNIMVRYNVLTYDHIQKCGGPVSCRGNR
jgi:parallel beta-helix repeat protein